MMRSWIHFTRGRYVRQARVGLGELHEEHLSRHGFQGLVAMLYRTEGPNEVIRVEGDYRARAVDSADVVSSDANDPRGDWQVMLANEDVAVAISRRRQPMPYRYRDMVGDLLYFVHRGSGTFATEFGPITYEPGDYIHLPKGTTFRHMPDDRDQILLVVETPGPIRPSEHENVGRHTPFDPTMLEVPDIVDYGFPAEKEYEVRLRHTGGHSAIFYKNDPLKVVGWKGDLFPFKLNIRSILPIMSDRIHLAPSSWATFEAPGVAILSIVPQVAVSDLNAEELPSYHRNIDMDEVILSHADSDPAGRRLGIFRHTPQGVLHGADEAARAEFQKKRRPGQHSHRHARRRRHLSPAHAEPGVREDGWVIATGAAAPRGRLRPTLLRRSAAHLERLFMPHTCRLRYPSGPARLSGNRTSALSLLRQVLGRRREAKIRGPRKCEGFDRRSCYGPLLIMVNVLDQCLLFRPAI